MILHRTTRAGNVKTAKINYNFLISNAAWNQKISQGKPMPATWNCNPNSIQKVFADKQPLTRAKLVKPRLKGTNSSVCNVPGLTVVPWRHAQRRPSRRARSLHMEGHRLIYNSRRCGGARHQYHADTRPRGQLSCWTKATGVYIGYPTLARVSRFGTGLRLFTQLTRLVLRIAWAMHARGPHTRTSWRTQKKSRTLLQRAREVQF